MDRCQRCNKALLLDEHLVSVEVNFNDYRGPASDKRELEAQVCAACYAEVEQAITGVLRVRSLFMAPHDAVITSTTANTP